MKRSRKAKSQTMVELVEHVAKILNKPSTWSYSVEDAVSIYASLLAPQPGTGTERGFANEVGRSCIMKAMKILPC
jgi:hypothetical protein